MCLGQHVINLERLHGGGLRLYPYFIGSKISRVSEKIVGISEAGICQRVIWIAADSLLEIIDCFFETIFRPLVPIIKTAQIQLVRLRVLGVALG